MVTSVKPILSDPKRQKDVHGVNFLCGPSGLLTHIAKYFLSCFFHVSAVRVVNFLCGRWGLLTHLAKYFLSFFIICRLYFD